ncbi:hypothetical protein SK854_44415 [Lentzea sp. BCCO 10_0061]|uniref:Uncharacterized protein n=1 Tax=Lentzea sokolovensis TaxID=3095429 RepID=A0ABU4VBP8_9PSEU|nr:hypothetical protein [Lentzea sp. BCCO 10_0061]MDX8149232.1 hypothetical protein [Lentzea sp. BCCO 10_0061]
MDAATAALVGAGVGIIGAIAASWINPFTTAKHARAAKNLELRREAYVKGLNAAQTLRVCEDQPDFERALQASWDAWIEMSLVASPEVAALFGKAHAAADKANDAWVESSPSQDFMKFQKSFISAVAEFTSAARADIGAGKPYKEK